MPRRLPLAFLLISLAACGGGRAPLATPASTLTAPDAAERSLLLLLAERGTYEPFTVEKSLAGSADLRRFLALTLGWSGAAEGEPVLAGLLLDDAPAVRQAAAFALGRVEGERARAALLASVAGADRATAIAAVATAGRRGLALLDVVEALVSLPEAERWARLLPDLWRFDASAAVAVAERGLAAAGPELRPAAAFALTRLATARERPAITALLTDPDPRVRAWAVRALVRLGGTEPGAFSPLLDGTEVRPVVAALAGVAVEARSSERAARLARLVGDRRAAVRWAALAAAPAHLPDHTLEAALAELGERGSVWQQAAALEALARGRSALAGPLAARARSSAEPRLRAAAVVAYATFGAAAELAPLRSDAAPLVRSTALLASLDRELGERRALLAVGLTDLDAGVRTSLLAWLERRPVLPFESLEASLALAKGDGLATSRRVAVAAIAARGKAEPLERGSVVRVLEKLAEEPDAVIRREAQAGLALLDRPPAPESPLAGRLGAEVYRDVLWQTARPRFYELATERGKLLARLPCADTPRTCLNFIQLVGQRAYDGVRVVGFAPGEAIETGDRDGMPFIDPGYALRDEPLPIPCKRGSLAMATDGKDTAGGRLRIFLAEQPQLTGEVTIFGEIIQGLEVLDTLEPGDRIVAVREVPAPRGRG